MASAAESLPLRGCLLGHPPLIGMLASTIALKRCPVNHFLLSSQTSPRISCFLPSYFAFYFSKMDFDIGR
jgi:hypothetical protein